MNEPIAQVIPKQPVQPPTQQPVQKPIAHSHKVLYTSLGLLFSAVVMLLIVVGIVFYKGRNIVPAPAGQTVQPQEQQSQVMMEETGNSTPISSKQELDAQVTTLDSQDTGAVTAGLDQNSADASQFSQ